MTLVVTDRYTAIRVVTLLIRHDCSFSVWPEPQPEPMFYNIHSHHDHLKAIERDLKAEDIKCWWADVPQVSSNAHQPNSSI